MANRRTSEQLKADRIIKKELLLLGDRVLDKAVPSSRRDTGRLQDEMNFEVKPDTTLTMFQLYYGAYNYPEGKETGERNALWIEAKKQIPKATENIVKNINDVLLSDFIKNK